MSQKLFEEKYLACYFDESIPVVAHTWKGYVQSEVFRAGINRCLNEYVEIKNTGKHANLHWICNASQLKVITPQDSSWVNTEFAAMMHKQGIRRVAMVVPTDVFAKMATESFGKQVSKQVKANQMETLVEYFDSEQKAKEWLKIQ